MSIVILDTEKESRTMPDEKTTPPKDQPQKNGRPLNNNTLMRVIHPDYLGEKIITSLDFDDPKALAMAVASQNTPDFRGDTLGGEVFPIVDWMIEGVEYEDRETKAMRPGVRVTLFDGDQRTLGSSSEALVRALDTIIQFKGCLTLDPPVSITMKPAKTGAGNQTYAVRIV